ATIARKALHRPEERTPLYISLPDFYQSGMSTDDFLLQIEAEMLVAPQHRGLLLREIQDGNALLCLDGLHEVAASHRVELISSIVDPSNTDQSTSASPALRPIVRPLPRRVVALAERGGSIINGFGGILIITSRPNDYSEASMSPVVLPVWTIQPMSDL